MKGAQDICLEEATSLKYDKTLDPLVITKIGLTLILKIKVKIN